MCQTCVYVRQTYKHASGHRNHIFDMWKISEGQCSLFSRFLKFSASMLPITCVTMFLHLPSVVTCVTHVFTYARPYEHVSGHRNHIFDMWKFQKDSFHCFLAFSNFRRPSCRYLVLKYFYTVRLFKTCVRHVFTCARHTNMCLVIVTTYLTCEIF